MNRLKELREDIDLRQEDVAKILGITRGTCAQYELGILNISIDNLKKLSSFYNTSIDYILYRTDNRKPYSKINSNNGINRLKELRNINSKTQKQVSMELGIPLKSYIKYENSSRSLNIQLLNKLSDYYNTGIDYIVFNTYESKQYKKSIVDWMEK